MIPVLILFAGVAAVILGAHWLVEGASALAKRLKISDLAIGLTVVAFGTSLPEMVVNVFAAIENHPAVALGNITGSNIANILLILGLSSLICPIPVCKSTTWKEIPLAFLAAILLWAFCADTVLDGAAISILSRTEALAFLGFFAIFLFYTAGMAGNIPAITEPQIRQDFSVVKIVLLIVTGLALLVGGGKAIVGGAVQLALAAGLSEGFIAATLVAIGTSLPELATSLVAAAKKKPDIAIGNIVGSNIFNVFLVLGVSGLIRPLAITPELIPGLWIGTLAAGFLFVCMFTGKRHKIDRWEGAAMLVFYVVFLWITRRS